jgi:hypothetical protein
MSQDKPREFWVLKANVEDDNVPTTPPDFPELFYHVIEKSAYDALKKERDELQEDYDQLLSADHAGLSEILKALKQRRLENAELREKLEARNKRVDEYKMAYRRYRELAVKERDELRAEIERLEAMHGRLRAEYQALTKASSEVVKERDVAVAKCAELENLVLEMSKKLDLAGMTYLDAASLEKRIEEVLGEKK